MKRTKQAFIVFTMLGVLAVSLLTATPAYAQCPDGGPGADTIYCNTLDPDNIFGYAGNDWIIIDTSGFVVGNIWAGSDSDIVDNFGIVIGNIDGGEGNDIISSDLCYPICITDGLIN